ncbi:c-type cytochrome biogenesis protein CcmI [Psychrosphaera sp. B3R10]|uniref:c-type cytochrome biogenesis protein CcmI n=1 Tax=unclassified Psychrosphaera TaxID=2641570 RepID=UPI001C09E531|nr:c-type cytochrome biogenesis protein CcmI [Psychrosphaera sp. I2R16]MBU2990882.1 c-type cytochrome biogenesis protein CcmI [Psychrosphaera sp. B3R10]
MSSLFFSFIGMCIVALVFICVPLFRFSQFGHKRNASAQWFEQRLAELTDELEQGRFTQQQYEFAVTELKLTTKFELTKENKVQPTIINEFGFSSKILISVLFVVFISGFYLFYGNYTKLSNWQDSIDELPDLTQKIIQNQNQAPTVQELQSFALGLRTKLAVKDEAIGWMLLGRTLLALNDINSAIDAFKKSYDRDPKSVTNIVNYAQALYLKGEDFELGKAVNILREALYLQPDNMMALIIFGESNLLLKRFDNAKEAFELALSQLNADDERTVALRQRIEFINQSTGTQAPDTQTNDIQSGLTITVQLDDRVTASGTQFRYLFLFAKSASSPVPVAVKKLPISNFPLTVNLSDSDIMLPDVKLSDQSSVNITARLSIDEAAGLTAGEWQGELLDIKPSANEPITIVINKETK